MTAEPTLYELAMASQAEVTRLRALTARLVEALEAIAERMEGNGMGQWKEARAARAALAAAREETRP